MFQSGGPMRPSLFRALPAILPLMLTPTAIAALPNPAPSFAVDLYHQLAPAQPDKNLFLSPYSIRVALLMAAKGARARTADQMNAALHATANIQSDTDLFKHLTAAPQEDSAFRLTIANALWID